MKSNDIATMSTWKKMIRHLPLIEYGITFDIRMLPTQERFFIPITFFVAPRCPDLLDLRRMSCQIKYSNQKDPDHRE